MRVPLYAIATTHAAHEAMMPHDGNDAAVMSTMTDGSLYFLVANVLHCIRILLQIKLYVIF